jgi:hypothetical protein
MLSYNTATVRDSTATHSLPKQHYDASAYNHVSKCTASMIVGSHLVNEKVNPANKVGKQWKQYKSWNHLKTYIFYSGDPGDLIKPAEKWGEKMKIIDGCSNLNSSTTIHLFQTIILALERYTYVDAIQVLQHHYPTGIGVGTGSIVNINGEPPFQHFILFVVTI